MLMKPLSHTHTYRNIFVYVKNTYVHVCIHIHIYNYIKNYVFYIYLFIYLCVRLCVCDQVLLLTELSPSFWDTETAHRQL